MASILIDRIEGGLARRVTFRDDDGDELSVQISMAGDVRINAQVEPFRMTASQWLFFIRAISDASENS